MLCTLALLGALGVAVAYLGDRYSVSATNDHLLDGIAPFGGPKQAQPKR